MYLTQKNQVRHLRKEEYDLFRLLTRLAKNVYNEMNYALKNHYEVNGTFLTFYETCKMVKDSENYQKMPSQVGQQVLKVLEKNWKSFFRLIEERKKGNYNRPIHSPRYLPKQGYFPCIFQTQSFKIVEDGTVARLSMGNWFKNEKNKRFFFFKIPSHVVGHPIKEIRMLPRYDARFFEIEYIYNHEPIPTDLNATKYVGIDLGLNNFASCYSTDGASYIINGKGIKAYNQWWNKQKARLQSQYDNQGLKFGRKMAYLLRNRKNKMNNFLSQSVNIIIKKCVSDKIGNVIIGKLEGIKQNALLGKKNNQHFQSIPYAFFKQKLKSKCELYGIHYEEVSEAHTSQTCCRCGQVRKSNRKHRGLYTCKQCKLIVNADSNGSINIIKKVFPEFQIGDSRVVNTPACITILS